MSARLLVLTALVLVATAAPSPGQGTPGHVLSFEKISNGIGGFPSGLISLSDGFAHAVARIDDMDGDGNPEMAVGAPLTDDGGTDRGAVWICFLASDGTVKSATKISATSGGLPAVYGDETQFGRSVTSPGDIDDDGVPDLVVGGPSSGLVNVDGQVFVLFLNADGTVKGVTVIGEGQSGFVGPTDVRDLFGWSVASAGDFDDNGVPDIIVGARRGNDGGIDRGVVWLLMLESDGTVSSEVRISDTAGGFGGVLQNNHYFGSSVTCLGDVDLDGVDDFAVGAEGDDDVATSAGAVWILLMNADGTVKSETEIDGADLPITLNAFDEFGACVAGLGDFDGDGLKDLAVGQPGYDATDPDVGAVWILSLASDQSVLRSVQITTQQVGLTEIMYSNADFGIALANLGDIDGDGRVNLAAGRGQGYGFIYDLFLNSAVWEDRGGGAAGTFGVPRLQGVGSLVAGEDSAVTLSNTLPNTVVWILVGYTELNLPFAGGVIVPDFGAPGLARALATDVAGQYVIPTVWPTGIPAGSELFYQYWLRDPAGVLGWAASNGLRCVTP